MPLTVIQSDGNSSFYVTGEDTVFLPDPLTPGSKIVLGLFSKAVTAPALTNNRGLTFVLEGSSSIGPDDSYGYLWVADNPSSNGTLIVDFNLGSEFGYWCSAIIEIPENFIVDDLMFSHPVGTVPSLGPTSPISANGLGIFIAGSSGTISDMDPEETFIYTDAPPHGNTYHQAVGFAYASLNATNTFTASMTTTFAYDHLIVVTLAEAVASMDGSISGSHIWSGTLSGKRTPKGTISGAASWVGNVTGDNGQDPIGYVKEVGFVTNTTAGSTSVITVAAGGVPVGDHVVVYAAADNVGVNGAAQSMVVTDTRGNTYATQSPAALADPGAQAAGAAGYLAVAKITTALQAGDTITITWGSSTTAKAVNAQQFHGVHLTTAVLASSYATQNNQTGTTNSVAATPTAVGQAVCALIAVEGGTADGFTQDADTTNGPWVTLTRRGSGTTTTGMTLNSVYKIVTASGLQTYNPTLGTARDHCAAILVLDVQPAPPSPKIGSFSGSNIWAGSVSGKRIPKGTVSGVVGFVGYFTNEQWTFVEDFSGGLEKWSIAHWSTVLLADAERSHVHAADFSGGANPVEVPPNHIDITSGVLTLGVTPQNYGDIILRAHQPMAMGALNVIEVDVEVPLERFLHGHTFVYVSEKPYTSPSFLGDNNGGPTIENGFGVWFNRNRAVASGDFYSAPEFVVWTNHDQVILFPGTTVVHPFSGLVTVRIEWDDTEISIYLNDVLWATTAWTLPSFSTGYVYVGGHNHASMKYSPGWVSYNARFGGVRFGGDTIQTPVVCRVPDNTVDHDLTELVVDTGNILIPGMDFGWASPASLTLTSVPEVGSAILILTAKASIANDLENVGVSYRFNDGTWHAVTDFWMSVPGSLLVSEIVNISDLVVGTNEIEIDITNASVGGAPSIGNVSLIITEAFTMEGSISGSNVWAGTVSGERTPEGSISGSNVWSGSVSGERVPEGSISGSNVWAGTVSGERVPEGSISGSNVWAGSILGEIVPEGSISGSNQWTAFFSGGLFAGGVFSGIYSFTGAISGESAPEGSISGSNVWSGSVSGERTPEGSISGSNVWSGSILGEIVPEGSISGFNVWAGSISGERVPEGSISGSNVWFAFISGGSFAGGMVSGSHIWSGTLHGKRIAEGFIFATIAWIGSTTGYSPNVDDNEGSISGVFSWAGSISGIKTPKGNVSGETSWPGVIFGSKHSNAIFFGTIVWIGNVTAAFTVDPAIFLMPPHIIGYARGLGAVGHVKDVVVGHKPRIVQGRSLE